MAGVYIFHFYMSYWLVGEKYDGLLREHANIREKRRKNGGKEEFSLYLGEKKSFWKKWGGGQKKSNFRTIYTPVPWLRGGKRTLFFF